MNLKYAILTVSELCILKVMIMTDTEKKKYFTPDLVCSYFAEFTVCGFFGWLYEVAVMYAMWHQFDNRGFLHIPVLPIYGFFAMILLLIFRRKNGLFYVFFVSMAVTTAGELISSYIIEWVLHEQLWTYEMWRFNFQGRIALYSSLMFGGLSVLLVKAVHPLMRLFHKKAPKTSAALGMLCLLMILTDLVITLKERIGQ